MTLDKACFLLGGGPSLSLFNYSKLKDHFTIGINKIFKVFSPNIIYCMDTKFYTYIYLPKERKLAGDYNLLEQWKNCPSQKMFLSHATDPLVRKKSSIFKEEDKITLIPRIRSRTVSLDIKQGIYPGSNSGFGAMMLAIAMGYKEIYLLGYDMKTTEGKTHFHNGYINQTVLSQSRHLEQFRKQFDSFADTIKKAGIQVINLNPDSALTCFEKRSIDSVI